MQSTIPGYTGFKPTQESYGPPQVQREQGAKIPGTFLQLFKIINIGY